MSGWGPAWDVNHEMLHIVPCDKDRVVLPGHVLSKECVCSPRQDYQISTLWIHNDREHGGYDS